MQLNIILILLSIVIIPLNLIADWRKAIYSHAKISRLEGIALDSRKPKKPINPCEFLNVKKIPYSEKSCDPECIQSGEVIAHTVQYHLCKDEIDWFNGVGNDVYEKEDKYKFINFFNWYMYGKV